MPCPRCGYGGYVQRGSGFKSAMGRAIAREMGKRMVRSYMGRQMGLRQRGSGVFSEVGGLAKRALTSDLAKVIYADAGRAIMGKLMPKAKPKPRRKRKRRTKDLQRGGILPALAIAAPLIAKTVGLGALSGGAGFGVSELLKAIT